MLVIDAICVLFVAMIFVMPILYPNTKIKDHNRGEK